MLVIFVTSWYFNDLNYYLGTERTDIWLSHWSSEKSVALSSRVTNLELVARGWLKLSSTFNSVWPMKKQQQQQNTARSSSLFPLHSCFSLPFLWGLIEPGARGFWEKATPVYRVLEWQAQDGQWVQLVVAVPRAADLDRDKRFELYKEPVPYSILTIWCGWSKRKKAKNVYVHSL